MRRNQKGGTSRDAKRGLTSEKENVPIFCLQSADEGAVDPVALCRSGILGIEALCPESGDQPPLSSSFPHLKPMRDHHSLNVRCHSLAACRLLPSKKAEIEP
jgi:hypothetical protein